MTKKQLLEYAQTTHTQNVQFNNIANRISYHLLERLYELASKGIDVADMSFNHKFIESILTDDYSKDENGEPDPTMVEFLYELRKLNIVFKENIDDVSEYNRLKNGGYIIKLNYRHTNTFKNLKGFINQVRNKNQYNFIGIKGLNTLPVRQFLRRIKGEEEINLSDFESFLRTNDRTAYKTFKSEIKRTLVHELKHMFDDVRTNGKFRQDKESSEYYKAPDSNKPEYYQLRHEIDARIAQGLNQTDNFIDKIDDFNKYFQIFIDKGYREYDFNQLEDKHKRYVRDEVEHYYDNYKVGHRPTQKYNLNESMLKNDEKINLLNKGIDIVCEDLGVERPVVHLLEDKQFTKENKSFAAYSPSSHEVFCVIEGRNTADCMRSIAHELMHHKQNLEGRLTETAGKDGDDFENEANTYSGKIMRRLGRELENIFEDHTEAVLKINECKRITKKQIIQENKINSVEEFTRNILGKFI